jgi:hypothetical protein
MKHALTASLVATIFLCGSAVPLGAYQATTTSRGKMAQPDAASQGSLVFLSWWVGKYPSDTDAPGRPPNAGKTFFEEPSILPVLRGMLPPQALRIMLEGWKNGRVETPILREGDIIKASFCKPHACPDENAAVFINVRTGEVHICWKRFESARNATKTLWYAPGSEPMELDAKEDCFGGEAFDLWRRLGTK